MARRPCVIRCFQVQHSYFTVPALYTPCDDVATVPMNNKASRSCKGESKDSNSAVWHNGGEISFAASEMVKLYAVQAKGCMCPDVGMAWHCSLYGTL